MQARSVEVATPHTVWRVRRGCACMQMHAMQASMPPRWVPPRDAAPAAGEPRAGAHPPYRVRDRLDPIARGANDPILPRVASVRHGGDG